MLKLFFLGWWLLTCAAYGNDQAVALVRDIRISGAGIQVAGSV